MKLAIEIFSRRGLLGKRFYFRIRSKANGKILASSEAYQNRQDCVNTAATLRAHMFDAEIVNL